MVEMNITEHFTLEELTRSETARAKGINNAPDGKARAELVRLCTTVLEPLRAAYGAPIIVSSGYRSPHLNKAVGGVANSQHLKGQAADVHSVSDTKQDNKRLFDVAAEMVRKGKIKVGQLVDEYGYNWVHISTGTKNEILHIH